MRIITVCYQMFARSKGQMTGQLTSKHLHLPNIHSKVYNYTLQSKICFIVTAKPTTVKLVLSDHVWAKKSGLCIEVVF